MVGIVKELGEIFKQVAAPGSIFEFVIFSFAFFSKIILISDAKRVSSLAGLLEVIPDVFSQTGLALLR